MEKRHRYPHGADQYDSGVAVHSKEVRRDGPVFTTGRPGAVVVIERETPEEVGEELRSVADEVSNRSAGSYEG